MDFSHVRTDQMSLDRPNCGDLDELHALYADPAVWKHNPTLRHTNPAQTADHLTRLQHSWNQVGLGSWVARDPQGNLIGIGGCSYRPGTTWNLAYRLIPPAWGHGHAQHIITQARAAAAHVDPGLPITASMLENNTRSRRAAQRAGLHLIWSGPDFDSNAAPAPTRLIYADRPVDRLTLGRLTHH